MKKWTEYIAVAVIVVVLLITYALMYTTWSDCPDAGGTTVRGLFG